MSIEDAILDFTARLSPVRERKLVAVSGGRDSVALLHALHAAGHRRLVVCHLNHRLRGRAAAADAAFVQRLAASLELPADMGAADVKREAAAQRLSLETAGRAARHRFFLECARRHRCPRILMAHHANDQAETALFNLFRGAAGLKGMSAVTTLHPPPGTRGSLTILRPLLAVTRGDIDTYIAAHRLKFREDATNAEPDTSRNRLRLEVMPAIARAMGRDPVPAILRALEILQADDACLEHQAGTLLAAEAAAAGPPGSLGVAFPAGLHPAMQRRLLRAWMTGQHRLPSIGFDAIESVRSMLQPGGPRAVNLPGNHHIRRRRGRLIVEKAEP